MNTIDIQKWSVEEKTMILKYLDTCARLSLLLHNEWLESRDLMWAYHWIMDWDA